MEDKIELGALYKIKNGKKLCRIEELLSPYVIVQSFISNPLEKGSWYVEFAYCFKESLELTSHIHPFRFVPWDIFLEYFNLDMTTKQVNELFYKLNKDTEI